VWVFFVLGPIAFLAAALVHSRARARENAIRAAVEAEELAKLAEHGAVRGSALGSYQLQAWVKDVGVTVTADETRRVPGSIPSDAEDDGDNVRRVWVAKVTADLPPRAILQSTDAERIAQGRWSATTTGSTRFDRIYRIGVDGHGQGTAYRGTADDRARWLTGTLAERLASLDLQWIEIKESTAELAFSRLAPECVGAALAAAASVAKLSVGQPEIPHPTVSAVAPDDRIVAGNATTLVSAAGIVTLVLAPLGSGIAFFPPVHESVAEQCCGPGGKIEVTSSQDDEGTSYGLACEGRPEGSLALAYLLGLSIWATFVLSAGVIAAASRWPKRARP
jgi:hypothetical protein